jgi:hypothetical protein
MGICFLWARYPKEMRCVRQFQAKALRSSQYSCEVQRKIIKGIKQMLPSLYS